MKKKDDVQLAKARALKAVRTAIRLKHALAADAEVNEVLPEVEKEFDRAVNAGKPFELNVGSVFEDEQ